MSPLAPLPIQDPDSLETAEIWRALRDAHRDLAELKGLCASLPNPGILVETLALQEAKDSSEIENIITTHDELYSSQSQGEAHLTGAAKEVQHYVSALKKGYTSVRESGLIRLDTILQVQAEIEQNDAGLRKVPGTVLKNEATGQIIYQPPQSKTEVEALMANLIDFIHAEDELDPLLRMAICHHQFESIHPFYDGNGRTGRILNILILIREGLLDLPLLYLSRYINRHKASYYRLLQDVRDNGSWHHWCIYMLRGVSLTARSETHLIKQLHQLMQRYKQEIRSRLPKLYSQDLLNNLFRYPYTKIEFIEKELRVSRPTATRYLEELHTAGFLDKNKIGRTNFYINLPLYTLLTNIELEP